MKKYILIPNLEQLIESTKHEKKFLLEELKRMANQYQQTPLSKTPPIASTTYMGMAIFNLSLLYLVTNDDTYALEAKRWMNTVVSYDEWGYSYLVNVDLSASWILFGLSLGYHYLYDLLTEAEKDKIYKKLVKQADIMYEYRQKTYGHGWSTQYYQNHNWINMTGLATVGYVLKDQYKNANEWVKTSKENFTNVYPNLADDGSDYEGVPYWHYGVLWLFVYADLLKTEEGHDYFESTNFLKHSFDYKMAQTLPDLKQIINFGDAHDYRSGHSVAMYFKIASEYENGYAQWIGKYVFEHFYQEEQAESHVKPGITCEIGLSMLWYNHQVLEKPLNDYPNYQYFEDLGLLSYKVGSQDASKMFSIKCEKPGGRKQFNKAFEYLEQGINLFGLSHHHPDNTHFILTKDGEYYVIDDGYNRLVGMKHHNVITAGKYGCDVEFVSDPYTSSIRHQMENHVFDKNLYGGEVKLSKCIDDTVFYMAETSGIFAKEAEIIKDERLVITPGLEYVIIHDIVDSNKTHAYQWHFHTIVNPKIEQEKMTVELSDTLCVETILPKKFNRLQEIQTIKSLYTPQEPNDFRLIDMVDSIIESEIKHSETFLNVLSFDKVTVTKRDGFIEINLKDRKDVFVYQQNPTYKTNATFAFIKDLNSPNEKIYLYQGNQLSIEGVVKSSYEIL